MGKAVRMGVGAASELLKDQPALDGIIIGTANGGMEDCIRFLNQLMQYDEGTLTPTNFVQSTANAIAAQIGLSFRNKGYNITHVHRGLAFEHAMIDAAMQLKENAIATYLLAGIDEISTYNYNIEKSGGWYKTENISQANLYEGDTTGSIAGEGVAAFLVNNRGEGAVAKVMAMKTLHTRSANDVKQELQSFLQHNLGNREIDILMSGENGDCRINHFYHEVESLFDKNVIVTRFKHLSGEYPTASAFALWLSCEMISSQKIPENIMKAAARKKSFTTIMIYNNYKGLQHGFVLLGK